MDYFAIGTLSSTCTHVSLCPLGLRIAVKYLDDANFFELSSQDLYTYLVPTRDITPFFVDGTSHVPYCFPRFPPYLQLEL